MDWIDRAVVDETDAAHPLNGPRWVRREYLRWALAAGDRSVMSALTFAMLWVSASWGQPEGRQ